MTKLYAIFLIILSTLLTTIAQLMYKAGIERFSFSISGILFNIHLLGGVFLYCGAAALFIIALKNGELSILYPIFSTGFIWVALLSIFLFGESSSITKWSGIFLIAFGTALLSIKRK